MPDKCEFAVGDHVRIKPGQTNSYYFDPEREYTIRLIRGETVSFEETQFVACVDELAPYGGPW